MPMLNQLQAVVPVAPPLFLLPAAFFSRLLLFFAGVGEQAVVLSRTLFGVHLLAEEVAA